MIAVTLDRVTISYASHPVFSDLSFEVPDDRAIGLVGSNGSGKSSLLRAIAGEVAPASGSVARRTGLSVGYLPQELGFPQTATVYDIVRGGADELRIIERNLDEVERRLGDPEVFENDDSLQRTLHEQERLLEAYDLAGGPGIEARIRGILRRLGFRDDDLSRPIGELSGGQRKLVGLAAQALGQPELLLLDEPDNHLDLAAKAHLQRFVQGYPGGVILVSHDRYLLDLVVDEIAELEGGRLSRFPGNYSEYAVSREQLRARRQKRYADQQKEIDRLERSASRLMTWGKVFDNPKFSQRGKAILKRLERMERVEAPATQPAMRLELIGWRGSSKVVELRELSKSFPSGEDSRASERAVLEGIDLIVRHGERLGIVGPNGSGKTVLFRILLGEETATGGEVVVGPSVRIGYYAQEHETLDPRRSLIDTLRHGAGISEAAAVRTLTRFAFNYEQAKRPVADLSGGERSRLQLALIVHSGANLLLLDEPTNNLDIASAEILEEALEGFEGTVLAISHDRYFLDRMADRVAELRGGAMRVHIGGYSAAITRGEMQEGLP
ncbi:MAG: ABC-F family ATP-binding cassette domain-containing protein [Candidatus Bipolaricaulota bacterium]|nr:MAG: ABC-F family ATP-binding cassette domain-containing protein [Candidatus Bipolaricaulota bacterium]